MTINMGPHHPATHGVLRLIVTLRGEQILDLKPVVGYLHTGIEKSCEDKSYWKAIPFVERMDYLSYFFNMEAFCGCVERLLELEIPDRAKYLRVLHLELNRIMSHLVWLGTSALDLGAISLLWYCFRQRDYDPRPVRDVDRAAHAYPLLPGRRGLRGHPGRVRGEGPPVLPRDATADRPVRGAPGPQRDLPPAHQGHRDRLPRAAAGARGHRAALAGRGRALGSPQGDRLPRLPRLRLQDPGRDGRRRLRPLPGAPPGDARVGADHRAGDRRPPRGPLDRRRPQGGAAAARRALRPRWRR